MNTPEQPALDILVPLVYCARHYSAHEQPVVPLRRELQVASSLATKLFGFLVFFLSVTAAYFAVNAIKQTQFPTTAVTVQPATPSPPVNPFAQAHGRHLVAYLFTASDCGWSNEPTLMKHLGQIRTLLRSVHHGRFAAITVVGVSLDTDVQVGMDFLSKIAGGTIAETFDEVSIGG